ncbi:hypothetical protein COLO4_16442 [Corchorus olitorius]|uniref:Fibronectin type III-like domain-containing protein n=1 Tax=Corchorus olitorius TaxID=93759 RepID=A0A1R3JHE4_9ROSI|nr:hypothetical protein COLO4_16442 [Corchorus olitorius]
MKLKKLSIIAPIYITSLLLLVSAQSNDQPPFSCDSSDPQTKSYPFCKTTLPINQRVEDLISRLTLDEKISQLVNSAPGISRLGIPGYEWWSEALHGVAFVANISQGIRFNGTIKSATSFPQVILTAASFDPYLWDPRWGRGQETPGEDPLLTGKYAVSFVRGIQGDSFEGGKLARGKWGFNGYITADCDAVSIIYDEQGYVKEPEDAVADVLKAGMDIDCGEYLKNYTESAVKKNKVNVTDIDRALHNLFSIRMRLGHFNGNPNKQPYGNIGSDQVCSQEHLNLALEAARNGIVLLKNTDRLLPLSKTQTTSLAVIGPNANSTDTLVGNYAGPPCKPITPLEGLQSYVKNTHFHPGCKTVNCSSDLSDQAVKIAEGADQVVLVMGLDQTQERESHDREDLVLPGNQQKLISSIAKAATKPVILVLLCGGPVDISFAKEDEKIGSIIWAGYPGEAGGQALAEIIFGDHNPGGRLPVTWYPQNLTKIPMTDMRIRPEPSSGYPGRTYRFYQGPKVFEFGYGLSYSNYSYEFLSIKQNKVYLNNQSSDKLAVGYKSVSDMGTQLCENTKFPVTVGVQNNGEMAGKHAVLLFVRQAKPGNGRPMKQLVGFNSVDLKAGEKAEIKFELSPCEHLSSANENGLMVIDEGSHFLSIGGKESEITVIFSSDASKQEGAMVVPKILIFFYIYALLSLFL